MDEHERPDPDDLLRRLQDEERRSQRGKLKIFFGYVAGVGKTYAMLESAQRQVAAGVDLVIGYAETTCGRQSRTASATACEPSVISIIYFSSCFMAIASLGHSAAQIPQPLQYA